MGRAVPSVGDAQGRGYLWNTLPAFNLAPLPISCGTLGKSPDLSGPPSLICKIRTIIVTLSIQGYLGTKEIVL